MGSGISRAPSSTNIYWTYRCRAVPSVSLELVDIYGKAQLLTLDQRDFFHGLSPDNIGWCIGEYNLLLLNSDETDESFDL